MWKRFQGYGREKQIGNPVLVETTYDEDRLQAIPNVAEAQNANYQHNAQSNPQAHNTLSPQYPRDYRASEVPTVSSMYSQPSPELRHHYNPAASGRPHFEDISPPSSPEPDLQQQEAPGQPRRFRSMRDVSPVDENRGRAGPPSKASSNIPVLRKAPPGLLNQESTKAQKFWGGKVAPNSKVRWDEYSGEPTSSGGGKASQISPGTYAKSAASPPSSERRPLGYHVSVTGPDGAPRKNPSLAERRTASGANPSPVETKPREPWSKLPGREPIAPPLKDQPSDKPLKFERKAQPLKKKDKARDAPNALPNAVTRVPVAADTEPVADTPDMFDMHEDPIKPIVPLKVGRNSPPRSLASPASPHYPGNQTPYSYPSPVTPTNKQYPAAAANGSSGTKPEPTQAHATPPNAKIARKSIEGTPGSTGSKDPVSASRFSWTTYNTSTTYQQSPPPSPPPPLPASSVPKDPASLAASILNRKRPVPPSDRSPVLDSGTILDRVPVRKPVTFAEPPQAVMRQRTMTADPPSPRPDSTFSTSTQKALPRPPTELAAADHIEILESQMEDLRIRRSNVYRLLRDLNNMAPANPMVTDFKRMRLVEKRKKDFEDELAEIRREEHEVGLKLHRAWRKRENADPGSESAIWIRRVTR